MILPRIYHNELGNYPEHEGKPKLSISQVNSFNEYIWGYLQHYFFGEPRTTGIFAEYGTAVGEYLENLRHNDRISPTDLEYISKVPRPKSATYEREIVIDRGDYVIQGFIDQDFLYRGKRSVIDFKTGSESKQYYYEDKTQYFQTRLYAYQLEQEGHTIGKCGVWLLPRKGNVALENITPSNEHNILRIVGDPIWIDTPYEKEDIEVYLKQIDSVAKEISDLYGFYLKSEQYGR